jgi:hypothetical protein
VAIAPAINGCTALDEHYRRAGMTLRTRAGAVSHDPG